MREKIYNLYRLADRILLSFCVIFLKRARAPLLKKGPVFGFGKILLIKFWGLGNLTIIWPLINRIRAKHPNARIYFLTLDTNREFIERHPDIDRVFYLPLSLNVFRLFLSFRSLLKSMRSDGIDAVINFETSNAFSGLFCFLISPGFSAGINNRGEGVFYSYSFKADKGLHVSRIFLGLLEPLDIRGGYEYAFFKKDIGKDSEVFLKLDSLGIKKFICIHPSTSDNFKGKRWSADRFARLADMIIGELGFSVLFTGISRDFSMIENIIAKMAMRQGAHNFAGSFDTWGFLELLRQCKLLISNDTAPVHFAASLGTNVAVLYGPSAPFNYGPSHSGGFYFYKGIPCSPCIGLGRDYRECRMGLECLDFSEEEVFGSIAKKFFPDDKDESSFKKHNFKQHCPSGVSV